MFHFSSPSPRLKCSRMNIRDLQHSGSLFESFPTHSIHLLIPSENAYKEKYESTLISDASTYFIVKDVPATCFIQKTFLECFVRSGLLLGVTKNARIEVDNFLSIIPPGKLVLSLETNIAQCLALHKENPQKKKKGKRLFQTIIIDLICEELSPGKKLYKFIYSELSKIDYIKFTLLLKWNPNGNTCPHSLKSYFISQGLECIACKPKHKYSSRFSVHVPNINFEMSYADVFHDTFEWIGMQICGVEYSTDENEYVSKLTVPEFFKTVNRLHKCSFEGFYSKAEILPVIQEMSKILETNSSLPYIIVCVSGFQDAYVQANGFQYFSSNDKLICMVIFPSSNCWLITLNCR